MLGTEHPMVLTLAVTASHGCGLDRLKRRNIFCDGYRDL
jgi:hypothetical protein